MDIETARGLMVDRLLAAGYPVVPVHPHAFHVMRPCWGASKARPDVGDSDKLVDSWPQGPDGQSHTFRGGLQPRSQRFHHELVTAG
ncbi:hypothetical protein [Streptomyces syringium]|uniref:hypothetical protein n=1 Tax=Streptomyces syringium TaxID=76729 RepID=UPI003435D398